MTVALVLENIQRKRRSKNYTQEYMGLRIGIPQEMYHKLETDKSDLSLKRFLLIAEILETDPREFFTSQDYPQTAVYWQEQRIAQLETTVAVLQDLLTRKINDKGGGGKSQYFFCQILRFLNIYNGSNNFYIEVNTTGHFCLTQRRYAPNALIIKVNRHQSWRTLRRCVENVQKCDRSIHIAERPVETQTGQHFGVSGSSKRVGITLFPDMFHSAAGGSQLEFDDTPVLSKLPKLPLTA